MPESPRSWLQASARLQGRPARGGSGNLAGFTVTDTRRGVAGTAGNTDKSLRQSYGRRFGRLSTPIDSPRYKAAGRPASLAGKGSYRTCKVNLQGQPARWSA